MKTMRMILLAGLGLSVAACTAVDVPTRNAPYEQLPNTSVAAPAGYDLLQPEYRVQPAAAVGQVMIPQTDSVARAATQDPGNPALAAGQAPVSINSVTVLVPRSLKVSERNSYLPRGDIVWREDPIGDRHAQVQKIVQDAMVRGVSPLSGPVKADLEIVVKRFHALTEKARYTTGGVHAITFDIVLKDPATGAQLMPPREVRADLEAFGGQQAINAEARGQTQKVRITGHLAEVIRQELTNPEGYKNASLGIIQVMNRL
ncbi:hypothetical protein KQ247_01620 [Ruegeria pomeroyi]|uniref:Lipoprotein, putative n=2 Tax=Ruegeria pomeroyi TaxID=89184 RepID=Q5LQG9_RUEPO|nr:DUF6778 family protein [Ruegeria pomeroyi]AAV95771.1 lipoprotein, putative [Ruegeria pomeroyi DSS-3]NVK98905.1 hypothetical protein [Ruegeria pomeroyi]NVL03113.1 hypothetical protein [Ruegeria pomeroyi]QWV09351.1 hypothetical protein KQ247_01620 [Ruegeria pomeroyi]